MKENEKYRCSWCGETPIYVDYHDNEWGRETHNDRELFELLILEGMQAGLSWLTVLKKREAFIKAFDNFEPKKVARYGEKEKEALMQNAGIIRNRLKINAAITNAQLFLEIQKEYGSFDAFIWSYVDNKPIIEKRAKVEEVPASTQLSDRISKDLKKRGFKFIGTTIIYSYMQSIGMVNDHVVDCFVYKELVRGV